MKNIPAKCKKFIQEKADSRNPAFRGRLDTACAVLRNTNGASTAMDIALDLIIGVVLALLVLAALKNLFNVDILPQVTDNITKMFS